MFDGKLKEQFLDIYKFSNQDKNKFILLLRKGVYPYEYMNDWEKFTETSLPQKEDFCSHLIRKILPMQITRTQKQFVKILK